MTAWYSLCILWSHGSSLNIIVFKFKMDLSVSGHGRQSSAMAWTIKKWKLTGHHWCESNLLPTPEFVNTAYSSLRVALPNGFVNDFQTRKIQSMNELKSLKFVHNYKIINQDMALAKSLTKLAIIDKIWSPGEMSGLSTRLKRSVVSEWACSMMSRSIRSELVSMSFRLETKRMSGRMLPHLREKCGPDILCLLCSAPLHRFSLTSATNPRQIAVSRFQLIWCCRIVKIYLQGRTSVD